MPPRSLSTSTNLLLRTNDNTSDMENKENMIRQLQWGQKTVIYSQVYLRKLSQYGKNGYKQGKGMQKWKLKQLFFYMYERLWEIHVQAGVLVATAFSDILCFGVLRCCVAPDHTLNQPMSSEWRNRHAVDPVHLKDIIFSNWDISATHNCVQLSVYCAFLQLQVCYLSFPLPIGVSCA